MRLFPLVIALTLVPLLALATPAEAFPPVCIVKEAGSEGGKVYAAVWVTCGPGVEVMTCPKDGFCTSYSTRDML